MRQSKEEINARRRARYQLVKQQTLAKEKEWYRNNPLQAKGRNLRKFWPEMSPKDRIDRYGKMLTEQEGLCAICDTPSGTEADGKSLAVDHCHSSGRTRGLLCSRCNVMIGMAKDRPEILRRGAEYLENHSQEGADA